MKVEEKLKILEEVQQELKEELGVDISIEEIDNVFQSQFKIMAYGFFKGIATTIPFFGKFVPYEKNFFKNHYILPNRKEQAKLIKEDKSDEALKIYIESLETVKKKKREILTPPSLSAVQVLEYNKDVEIPDIFDIFKNIK